jgi:hypothetical protein
LTYTHPDISAVVTLSRRDQALVVDLGVVKPVLWCPPGTPNAVLSSENAKFVPILCLSGSSDWKVKKRDLGRFFEELEGTEFKIVTDDILPTEILKRHDIGRARFDDTVFCSNNIRVGVIADRFVAGHKLKASFYISRNSVVFAFADIRGEFDGLPYADRFVRYVQNVGDIRAAVQSLSALEPNLLRRQFGEFQSACVERFSWKRVSRELSDTVLNVADNIKAR